MFFRTFNTITLFLPAQECFSPPVPYMYMHITDIFLSASQLIL